MMLYSAIVIFEQLGRKSACKYRNINNIDRFMSYIKKNWANKGVTAVNIYEKKSRNFVKQIKINEKSI